MATPRSLLSSIKMIDDSRAEIEILDEIVSGSEGFFGPLGVTDKDVRAMLKEAGSRNITVRINSPGGDAFAGVSIYNALRDYAGDVAVVVSGVAASAASVVAMAGDTITMQRGSMMMIHRATGRVLGTADEVAAAVKALRGLDDSMAAIYSARVHGADDDDDKRAAMLGTISATHWMTAEEAVDQGFADSVDGSSNLAAVAVDPATWARWGTVPQLAASLFSVTPSAQAPAPIPPKETPPMSDALTATLATHLGCDADELEPTLKALLATSEARATTITDLTAKVEAFEASAATHAASDFEAMLDEGQREGRWSAEERPADTLKTLGCLRASDLAALPAGVFPKARHAVAGEQREDFIEEPGGQPKHLQTRALAEGFAAAAGRSKYNGEDLRKARAQVYGGEN